MRKCLKGQGAIVVTLAIPIVLGAVCLGADCARVYREWMELQATADSAVLLGAAYLPANPVKARSIALQYAERKGLDAHTDVIDDRVSADHRSLTMTVRRKVHYAFEGLLGVSHDVITARAAAEIKVFAPVTSPVPASPETGPRPSPARMTDDMSLSRVGFGMRSLRARTSNG